MVKKRTAARRRPQKRAAPRKRSKATAARARTRGSRGPIQLAKHALTIKFKTESELSEHLRGLSSLFRASEPSGLETAGPAESCLSLIQALEIVIAALAPKAFTPTEKLGETYLTSQERELFRARAVRGVTGQGCQIGDTSVPAEETTTHSNVVNAIRDNAHA